MKLFLLLCASTLTLSIVSCNEKPAETKTIIVTEKTVEQPKTVVVEVEKTKEKEKETSIKIGPDGGSLNTKDVNIEVNK